MQGTHEIGGVGNVVNEPSAAFRIVEHNFNSKAKNIFPDVNKLLGILHFYYR